MVRMKIEENLKKKGWNAREIITAKRVLQRGELKQSVFQKLLYHFSFLTAIISFLLGHFLFSFSLIPVFLLTSSINLILFLIFFALIMGVLFELIIKNFEDKTHHLIIASLIIPLLILLNIYYTTSLSNSIAQAIFNSESNHNPLFASVIYLIVFIIPSTIHEFIKTFK